MKSLIAFAAALLAALPAFAGNALSDMHPEEAYPDNAPVLVTPDPYVDVVRQVQEKLHQLDFDPGPVNGASSSKLQAALAQFQLSRALPVSGMLDGQTLQELGVQPSEGQAAQGASSGEDRSLSGENRSLQGSCDGLIGPEKEQCLQQGGTVEVGVTQGSGASGAGSTRSSP